MAPDPIVAYCFCVGQSRPHALEEIHQQWGTVELTPQRPGHDYDYADDLRRLWRASGELVIIEQDVVPPPGSIRALIECPEPWCSHPHWVLSQYMTDSLGLTHFSQALRLRYPWLADVALAPLDHRALTRLGWTNLDPDSNQATLERRGPRACVRQDSTVPADWWDLRSRPSTVHWRVCDTHLSRQLHGLLGQPHVHQPATGHLHAY